MNIREGDRFIWNDSVYIEVASVSEASALIKCRTHPLGPVEWDKEQLLPFPASFIPVKQAE